MNRYRLTVNDKDVEVTLRERNGSLLTFSIGDTSYTVDVQPIIQRASASSGQASVVLQPAPVPRAGKKNANPGDHTAPMPGIVVKILVKEGDAVKQGQTLLVVEAMKMENNIPALVAGVVKKIHVAAQQEVENDQVLVTVG